MSERGRRWRRLARVGCGVALAVAAGVPAAGVTPQVTPAARAPETTAPTPVPDVTSFAVFALSRGKGVPPEALDVLRKVAEIADADERRGVQVETRRTRIGLEGETRLCVEYQSAAEARRGLEKVEKLVKDVDLVNLVPGPCGEPARRGRRRRSHDDPPGTDRKWSHRAPRPAALRLSPAGGDGALSDA